MRERGRRPRLPNRSLRGQMNDCIGFVAIECRLYGRRVENVEFEVVRGDSPAFGQQSRQQVAADETARPGDECVHGVQPARPGIAVL